MGGAIEASAQQVEATDAQIDRAVAVLGSHQSQEDYEFARLCPGNWPRVVWNYKQANGAMRSRILSAAHYAGGNASLNPLVVAATDDTGWGNRQMAATLVQRIAWDQKLVSTIQQLQRKLFHDRDWRVRIVVAKGLGWQYGPSVKAMLMALTRDPSDYVRIQAGMSLARQKDERAIPVLVELLDKQDGFPIVMDAGGEWGPENFLADFGEKMLPAIVPKLKSKSWKMRLHAMETLIGANAPKLFEYGKGLIHDPVPIVRFEGLRAVAWHRKPEAIPILIEALKDKTELAPRSTIADNVRGWLQYGAEVDSKPWPEGIAALKAAQGGKLAP